MGLKIKSQLQEAARLPAPQYAKAAEQVYAHYMHSVNDIVGNEIGWKLPVDKQAARHTKPYREVQQHIAKMEAAIKDCANERFWASKQAVVKQAVSILEQTLQCQQSDCDKSMEVMSTAQLDELILKSKRWVEKHTGFLKRFEVEDAKQAKYNFIEWANKKGKYTIVKRETFQQNQVCTVPVQDMAKFYGDMGKPKPGFEPPSEAEVMAFLGPSPVNSNSDSFQNAIKHFEGDYTREEYIKYFKHKRSTNPGILGVHSIVFWMLMKTDNEDLIDCIDLDVMFANAFRSHNKLYAPLRIFLCMLLQKTDKPSYDVEKAWRNILMGTPMRKCLTSMEAGRADKFINHMDAMGFTLISGRLGFPAATFAIKKVTLAIQMSEYYKTNWAGFGLDMDSCYPNQTKLICSWLLTWFNLPKDVVARFLEFNADNVAVMMEFKAIAMSKASPVAADFKNLESFTKSNTVHFNNLGTVQGCMSAMLLVKLLMLSLSFQLERADKGFQWPVDSITLTPGMPVPRPMEAGVAYADDILPMTGGGVGAKRLSTQQTLQNLEHIAMICVVWSSYFIPMGKCKAVGKLYDEQGHQIFPEAEFPVYTTDGVEQIKLQPLNDGVVLLGVAIGGDGAYKKSLNKINEREILLEEWMEDNNITRHVKMSFYIYSILGLRRYFASKVTIPSAVVKEEQQHITKVFKQILQVVPSTANAALYADTEDFGCGYPNLADCQHASDASHTFALANANTEWARGFFNMFLNWTRQRNSIQTVTDGSYYFFDWDVSKLSWTDANKLKYQNEITSLLATCLRQGLHVQLTHHDSVGPCWTMVPGPLAVAVNMNPESCPGKIRNIIKAHQKKGGNCYYNNADHRAELHRSSWPILSCQMHGGKKVQSAR